jgi:hypothetical protein
MEKDETKNNQTNASNDLSASSIKSGQAEEQNKSEATANVAEKHKSNPFKRSWKSSDPVARWTLTFVGLGAGAGVLYFVSFVSISIHQSCESARIYRLEHRPRVVFSRPPELLSQLSCDVTEKEIHLHTGSIRVWLKNLRGEDAEGLFITPIMFKFIPENKTGIPALDNPFEITERNCEVPQVRPEARTVTTPLNVGQETYIDYSASAGIFWISPEPVNSVTATWGAPHKSPPPEGSDIKKSKTEIALDGAVRLYAPICVFYFDASGNQYGSCISMRFQIQSGEEVFRCVDSPFMGSFVRSLGGYCQN